MNNIVKEKHLTHPELNKREEIAKAMKPKFKGDKNSLYAIATARAKELAEEGCVTGTGSSVVGNVGEQIPTTKAFGKKMIIKKSFLKELIQQEIRNIKK